MAQRPSRNSLVTKTAAATTGPASAPRPASSTPMRLAIPSICFRSKPRSWRRFMGGIRHKRPAGRKCRARSLASPPNLGIIPAMTLLQASELMFYIVETFALPFAIAVFIFEQRKERQNEEEEIFQRLSDEYREFLKLVLDNVDLHLLRREG